MINDIHELRYCQMYSSAIYSLMKLSRSLQLMRHYDRPVSAVLSLFMLNLTNLSYESTVVAKSKYYRYIRTVTGLLINYK